MLFARFKLRLAYKERTVGRSQPIMLEALATTLSSFIFVRLSELPYQTVIDAVMILSMMAL